MNKAKKLVMILLVLGACLLPLMAAQTMSVNWKWNHDDLDVTYYRYQLNGEAENAWTVVPADVLSYEATDLDPYSSYSLYLQCSYDGENWSESAVAVAEPLLTAAPEPAVVEAEPVVAEPVIEAPAVVEEPAVVAEPVEEAPAVEPVEEVEPAVVEPQPVEKKASYGYKTNLLISTGVSTDVSFDKFALNGYYPRLGLGLEFQNIVHAGHWGMGLRLDANVIGRPEANDWKQFDIKKMMYDASADGKLMMYMGNDSFDFYLGGGAGYSIFYPSASTATHTLGTLGPVATAWYASGNVGMRVRFNSIFSMGVEANYRYLMPAKTHSASADLVFGFSF